MEELWIFCEICNEECPHEECHEEEPHHQGE